MEKITKEGKSLEKILASIMEENNLSKEEFIYSYEEKSGKLFGSTYVVNAYLKTDINKEIKEYLEKLVTGLGLDVTIETIKGEDKPLFRIYSNKDAVLIGKEGTTLKSIELITKEMLSSIYGIHYQFRLDVSDYNEKKNKRIEKLAIRTAKEVMKTKVPVELDNMTSYERRIVHNALTDFKGISSASEGEEPNRHVVIKPL